MKKNTNKYSEHIHTINTGGTKMDNYWIIAGIWIWMLSLNLFYVKAYLEVRKDHKKTEIESPLKINK